MASNDLWCSRSPPLFAVMRYRERIRFRFFPGERKSARSVRRSRGSREVWHYLARLERREKCEQVVTRRRSHQRLFCLAIILVLCSYIWVHTNLSNLSLLTPILRCIFAFPAKITLSSPFTLIILSKNERLTRLSFLAYSNTLSRKVLLLINRASRSHL